LGKVRRTPSGRARAQHVASAWPVVPTHVQRAVRQRECQLPAVEPGGGEARRVIKLEFQMSGQRSLETATKRRLTMRKWKPVVVLQLVMIGVIALQVSALANCLGAEHCDPWASPCPGGCSVNLGEGSYANDHCCCVRPITLECCDFTCYYWNCYDGLGHPCGGPSAVTRTFRGGPYFKECGSLALECY